MSSMKNEPSREEERYAPLNDDLALSDDPAFMSSPVKPADVGTFGDFSHHGGLPDGEGSGKQLPSDSDDLHSGDDAMNPLFGSHYEPKSRLMKALNKVAPHGGLIANAYNLAAVTLGSGIIVLPSAFEATGVIVAVIVLAAISLCTIYAVYIMCQATDKTNRTLFTYEALARGLLGPGWDFLAAFNMWMFCFGSCVSYVISTGDLLSRATDGDSVAPFFRNTVWGNRVLVIIIWACVMLPLSIPKEINSLRFFSIIGVTCMMYFVVVIVIHAGQNGFENGKAKHELALFKSGNNALVGFSSFIFSFLCNTNTPEIYRETRNPRPRVLARDTAVSMSVCCVLYIIAGVFGYLDFGDKIFNSSILLFYDVRDDAKVAVAYFGIGIKMCVGFAICMQPSRDSVYYCLKWWFPMFSDVKTVPFWVNAAICTFMAIVALVLGLFIPSVTIVFNLVGSFCGGFLGFIFPALFIMYAGKWTLRSVGYFHYFATYGLLIVGVVCVCFGTVAAIYGEAS